MNPLPLPFAPPAGAGAFCFGAGFFLPPPKIRSSSRSFLEVSLVRPVGSTVRAVGAAGTVALVGDLGVEEEDMDSPEPKYLSNCPSD